MVALYTPGARVESVTDTAIAAGLVPVTGETVSQLALGASVKSAPVKSEVPKVTTFSAGRLPSSELKTILLLSKTSARILLFTINVLLINSELPSVSVINALISCWPSAS